MIGNKLAHYEIKQKIGSGGMGDVYRASDTKLGRDVAIKILPAEMSHDPERRKRFEREARAIAALKHPNIVTIYSVEEADGRHFITMELVEGERLTELIPADGLSLERFLQIAGPLADAIGNAHSEGITHRDIKPANIMVDKSGHVKVLDFGLAKLLQPDLERDTTVGADSDTQPGRVMGTVSYMSPEQAEGKTVDNRSDIFSLGIVFYEMATGQRPFKGESNLSIMTSILRDEPSTITDLKGNLPVQLGRIIQHCLAKKPERRFQSALDVRNELEALGAEMDTQMATRTTVTLPIPARHGKRLGFVAGAALLLVVAFLVVSNLFTGSEGPVPMAEANSLAVFAFENLKDPDDPERMGQIMQELLITDLSSLEALKVYSSQRLFDIEKQLKRDGSTGKEVASAVAAQAGAETMLTGSLSKLGDRWILACQLANVSDGTIVQSKRIDGQDLYAMVDQLTTEIQSDFRIAEPPEILEKISIRHKTSESLEAYRHYLDGVDRLNEQQFGEAIDELKKAVEIDPDFGQAYYKLGVAEWWHHSGVAGSGKDRFEYFLANKLHASEKERHMAEAMITLTEQRYAEGLPVLEELAKRYPDEKEAWYGLGEAYFHFPGGIRHEEALDAFGRAVALDPDFLLPYGHMLASLFVMRSYDELRTRIEELIERDPDDGLGYRFKAAMLSSIGSDAEAKAALAEALEHNPEPADRSQLYQMMSQSAGGRSRPDQQTAYLEKAIEVDPEEYNPALIRQMVGLLTQQHRWNEAEKFVREQLAKQPDDEMMNVVLIDTYGNRGQYTEARRQAEAFVKRFPENPSGYRHWVQNAISGGDDEIISRAIDQSMKRAQSPDERRALLSAIHQTYSQCGDLNNAIRYVEEAIAVDPTTDFADLLQRRGNYEMARGRYDEGERWLSKALAANPRNIGALIGLSILSRERGDREAADRYLERGIAAIPVDWVAPFIRAVTHIFAGELADAERELDRARSMEISDRDRWQQIAQRPFGIGWSYIAKGHPDKAREIFEYARTLEPGARRPDADDGLGWAHVFEGNYQEAERAFQRGLQRGYGHGSQLAGLAVSRLEQGQLNEAEQYARRALAEDRPHVAFHRVLGYVRAAQGKYDEALKIAHKTVAMDSTRASLELLAWVLVSGDIDVSSGVDIATQAFAIERRDALDADVVLPYRATAEHALGLAYLKKGEAAKAVEYLEKAVALQPRRKSAADDLGRARELAGRAP